MRVWELRVEIAKRVGTHERRPRSPLTSPTLNSLLAYFTGEYAVEPALTHAPVWPGREHLREEVAVQVEGIAGGMEGWFDRLDHGGYYDPPFNRSELCCVLASVIVTDDQRQGAGDYTILENAI